MKITLFPLKLAIVFVIAFSFIALQGSISSSSLLPNPALVRANNAPVESWYPNGPAMDTLVYKIEVDENAEFTDLQTGSLDLTDWPLPPLVVSTLIPSSNFYVTSPVSDNGYFELQFHLGSNFWGCNMNYGNSACGREIRQGMAHALDKTILTQQEASIAGTSLPVDNPVPPSVDLTIPNPCAWDSTHPESGSNCVVGEGGKTGGVAYHLAPAVPCGLASCASTPTFPWTPGLGTADFCAAADHFIAAGLATGKVGAPGTGTCVLTGISSSVASNPVNIYIRNDNTPRLHAGESIAQFICALLTGTYTLGCTGLTATLGGITNFAGTQTSPTTVSQGWNMYTAYVNDISTFDRSLYFLYNSRFVSGIPAIKQSGGGFCSNNSIPSYVAANYVYLCSPGYDNYTSQAEVAPCLNAIGDVQPGQTIATYADCPGTTQFTATTASYLAQNFFGQNAFTIPWFTMRSQYGYLSNWQRVVLHQGDGFTPPGNIPAELDAWSPNPAQVGTIRQGYLAGGASGGGYFLNPYTAQSSWDLGIIGNIWDKPSYVVPASPDWVTSNLNAPLMWIASSTFTLSPSQITYTPPPGTVAILRYTLRNDIFWQTGQQVTAWDLAFSDISLRASGAFTGSELAPVTGVKVLSRTQVDVDVNATFHGFPGVFNPQSLSTYVLPGRLWSTCSSSGWDSASSNPNFSAANTALTSCIGPDVTASGVILPTASSVDPSKILPGFDVGAAGLLVGSGPWECRSAVGTIGSGCYCFSCQPQPGLGSLTLQRYGFGTTPGGSLNAYFRSSGNLALWTWSGDTGDFNKDFLNFGVVSLCFGAPLQPLGTTTGCGHWQQGIGAPNGHAIIGLTQVGIVQRFVGVNWVSPHDWKNAPPQGIASFAPVLYEGISTGNSGNPFPVGASQTLNPASVVGCGSAYPAGGYDC